MAGKYRFAKKRRSRRAKFWRFAVFFLLFSLLLTCIVNARLRPLIRDIAASEANKLALTVINEGITRQLEEDNVCYDALSSVSYDEAGKVSMIRSNITAINAERANISLSILEGYEAQKLETRVPIGTVSGIDLLAGLGPKINVTLSPAPSIQTDIYNEFLEAGINQTVHRIMLEVTVLTRVVVPSASFTVTSKTAVCMAETIIVGDVPDAYTDINRSNGYIDESDIDDIYDFGASTS